MTIEILIAAQDINLKEKGDIATIKDQPCSWGNLEAPPKYVKVIITGTSKAQALHYLARWQPHYLFEILVENANGYRIKISADPSWISTAGVGGNKIKLEMLEFIQNNYGGVLRSSDTTELVVDIPKPVNLQEAKQNFNDVFEEFIKSRRWHITESQVDAILAAGGVVTRTAQQAVAIIKDKLLDE